MNQQHADKPRMHRLHYINVKWAWAEADSLGPTWLAAWHSVRMHLITSTNAFTSSDQAMQHRNTARARSSRTRRRSWLTHERYSASPPGPCHAVRRPSQNDPTLYPMPHLEALLLDARLVQHVRLRSHLRRRRTRRSALRRTTWAP